MTDQDGAAFRVVATADAAGAVSDDQRLPASYANFYIANDVVLMPAYDPETDRRAQRPCRPLPHPPGDPDRFHRPGLGPRRLSLRHPAVAGGSRESWS